MDYVEASSIESHGDYGSQGIKIMLTLSETPSKGAIEICRHYAEIIMREIRKVNAEDDPATAVARADMRTSILGLFDCVIYAKEIPNGYCRDACCLGRPWFMVTTKIGAITIGWRKRVISIDWSESEVTQTADELFAEENVTKGKHSIHAWSQGDARKYIRRIAHCGINAEELVNR